MSEELKQAYERYFPRWFKVIRWRDIIKRNGLETQRLMLFTFYVPVFIWINCTMDNPYPFLLAWYKPETQEERDKMKLKWIWTRKNLYLGRNWDMDKYQGHVPPLYDVWERRKQYPEYYGEKYNIFAGDAYGDYSPDGHP